MLEGRLEANRVILIFSTNFNKIKKIFAAEDVEILRLFEALQFMYNNPRMVKIAIFGLFLLFSLNIFSTCFVIYKQNFKSTTNPTVNISNEDFQEVCEIIDSHWKAFVGGITTMQSDTGKVDVKSLIIDGRELPPQLFSPECRKTCFQENQFNLFLERKKHYLEQNLRDLNYKM